MARLFGDGHLRTRRLRKAAKAWYEFVTHAPQPREYGETEEKSLSGMTLHAHNTQTLSLYLFKKKFPHPSRGRSMHRTQLLLEMTFSYVISPLDSSSTEMPRLVT